MRRVLVIGPCGAGKSTLGRRLAERTALPLFHMDQLNWKPRWIESSDQELRSNIRDVVGGDSWILEGTYGGTLDERLPRSDTVIYLDFPISLCLRRVMRRVLTGWGKSRPDMTEGCPEHLNIPFLWYVARWNSGPRVRLHRRLEGHWDKVLTFKTPEELEGWIDSLPGE